MALNDTQQAFEAISRAQSILIVSRANPTPDTVASVSALLHFLKLIQKNVTAVIPGFDSSQAPSFLSNSNEVQSTIGALRNLHISVDVSRVPLNEFFYDVRDKKLEITLVPKEGEWSPDDLVHTHDRERFDLIIALDCPDQKSLGSFDTQHTELLYRLPLLNIDASSENERWGQINLVDITSSSTAEILLSLMESWGEEWQNAEIATAILAGMMAKTKSFRTASVTPQTLATTAKLISAGGDRKAVVHGLWRTKNIKTLQLWGRVLSRLDHDKQSGITWSVLQRDDFLETNCHESTLGDVLDELLVFMSDAHGIALLYEPTDTKNVQVLLHARTPYSAEELARTFHAVGTRERVQFSSMKHTRVQDAVQEIIPVLISKMKDLSN
ncbi:MAG: hypothetical protein NUV81_03430 [bacterium]|nr:hypothetical protein [bacterium]